MAADVTVNPDSCPNCEAWEKKYATLLGKRNALRQGIELLAKRNEEVEGANRLLQKERDDERRRADTEQEEKEKERTDKALLEEEISELKSEISSLKEKDSSEAEDGSGKVKLLEERILKGDAEIKRLTELLNKEKTRADSARKNAESEKRQAAAAWKSVEVEKRKAEAERKNYDNERKKSEDYRLQLEKMRKEAEEAKMKLAFERVKWEETRTALEAEKKKVCDERRCTDSEKAKAEEQRKLAEEHQNRLREEIDRANNLSMVVQECRRKMERCGKEADEARLKLLLENRKCEEVSNKLKTEKSKVIEEKEHADLEKAKAMKQQKMAEENERRLMEEKVQAENLFREVEKGRRVVEKLQVELRKLLSFIQINAGHSHVVDEMDKVDNRLQTLAELVLTASECFELENNRPEEDPAVREAELQTDVAEKPKKRPWEGRCCSCSISSQLDVEMQNMEERPELQEHTSGKRRKVMTAQARREKGAEYQKLNLLRKRLKLEKMKAKHAREVTEFEKCRTRMLLQEVRRVKLDFAELSCRLEELDSCFSPDSGGVDEMKKKDDVENVQSCRRLFGFQPLQTNKNELLNSNSMSVAPSDNSRTEPSQLASGANPKDFASGINSKLEFLPGASNRKILQHSAITSAMASFSDKDLVGSQDKGDITMSSTPKLVEDNLNQQKDPCSPSDAWDAQRRDNGNFAGVAENIIDVGINLHCRKRRGLFGDAESIDQLCSESRHLNIPSEEKQPILHSTLNAHSDKSSKGAMCLIHELDSPVIVNNLNHQMIVQFHGNNEQKKQVSSVETCEGETCGEPLGENRREFRDNDSAHPSENAFDVIFCSGALVGDYMKLLELDNPIDEGEYREAIERPLSPTLPEINLEGIGAIDMDVEEDLRHLGCSDEKNRSFTDAGNVRLDLDRTDCSPQDKGLTVIGTVDKFLHDALPKFCISYSDINEIGAFSKIFKAMKNCMDRCSFPSQTDWAVRKILVELKAEEELLAKERICVFFSLLLLNFSMEGCWTLEKALSRDFFSLLGSFAEHMHAVMSDMEARSVLTELCNIDELLHLIRNFLVDGKLILCHYASSELLMRGDNIIRMNLGGLDVLFSSGTASSNLMIASSIILASICVAVNKINFICETSYQILRTHASDSSLLLTILHVFACQCGNRYFTQNEYCSLMSVLKSVVVALEMSNPGVDLCPVSGEVTVFKCPFKGEALCLDDVTEKLMEKIQTIAYSTHGMFDHLAEFEVLQTKKMVGETSHVDAVVVGDPSSNVLCCSSSALNPGSVSEANHGGILFQFDCLFTMLELIALKKGWEFTRRKIIPLLLKILETRMHESIVSAVVILLGQLGRLGVDAVGYDDEQVENMRHDLQALLEQAKTLKLGFSSQVSIVTALHWLLPHDFETLFQTDLTLPDIISLSEPAHKIRDWFSSLSIEEQTSSMALFKLFCR